MFSSLKNLGTSEGSLEIPSWIDWYYEFELKGASVSVLLLVFVDRFISNITSFVTSS